MNGRQQKLSLMGLCHWSIIRPIVGMLFYQAFVWNGVRQRLPTPLPRRDHIPFVTWFNETRLMEGNIVFKRTLFPPRACYHHGFLSSWLRFTFFRCCVVFHLYAVLRFGRSEDEYDGTEFYLRVYDLIYIIHHKVVQRIPDHLNLIMKFSILNFNQEPLPTQNQWVSPSQLLKNRFPWFHWYHSQ